MDAGLVTVIVTALTLLGTYFTVKYKNGMPHKKDRVELFFERYDEDRKEDRKDIKELREEIDKVRDENDDLRKELDLVRNDLAQALRSLADKDEKIKKLQSQVKNSNHKYQELLKRFNTLKLKYEKRDKGV